MDRRDRVSIAVVVGNLVGLALLVASLVQAHAPLFQWHVMPRNSLEMYADFILIGCMFVNLTLMYLRGGARVPSRLTPRPRGGYPWEKGTPIDLRDPRDPLGGNDR